jgi:hypothetical protein
MFHVECSCVPACEHYIILLHMLAQSVGSLPRGDDPPGWWAVVLANDVEMKGATISVRCGVQQQYFVRRGLELSITCDECPPVRGCSYLAVLCCV